VLEALSFRVVRLSVRVYVCPGGGILQLACRRLLVLFFEGQDQRYSVQITIGSYAPSFMLVFSRLVLT